MRKTVQLLAFLMAILYCSPAHAAVDPYEAMEITPAEGTVTSLQHFTITFAGLPVVVNTNAIPVLEKGGGVSINGHMSVAPDGTTVLIDFDEISTAPGHYYLHLPENSLTVNGTTLLPLTLRFNISGDETTFYEQISINPAEGVVQSLQNFTISFPEYIGEINDGSKASLRNDKTGVTYHAEMYAVGYNVLVYFPDEVKKNGNYTLTIPKGSVIIYTLDHEVEELNYHYTIEGGEEDTFYDHISISPIEGNTLSLQNFTITFPEAVDGIASGSKATLTCTTSGTTYQTELTAQGNKVLVNFPEEIVEPGDYTLHIPSASIIFNSLGEDLAELNFYYAVKLLTTSEYTLNPPEGELYLLQNFTIDYNTPIEVNENAVAYLVNDETGTSYPCNMLEIGGKAYIYKEYPLSILGSYTLHVPAACIELLADGTVNPAMTFHYTIIEKEYYVPTVIENQPEGELRIYQRTGRVIREVEKENVAEDEWPYEIISEDQYGSMNVVFGENNKVYFQRPVSWSYYNGWVEGTLSADGKTITIPMGQYVAYTYSLEMAVQVAMFTYDEERGSYFYNPDIEELTYTINDDGSISMNGTDEHNILGTMNRAFGQTFQYLDYEWLQDGDYESVYIPVNELPQTPPGNLPLETYYFTTAINDGMEWEPYFTTVNVGIDGEDMWLQGVSHFLPEAWIKGHIDGNTVTFPNSQLLGAYEVLLYFKAADYDPMTGATTQKDLVMTFDDENTLYTYDYIFITSDKNTLSYVSIYQGLTISKHADPSVTLPQGTRTYQYTVNYKTLDDVGSLINQHHTVNVGFAGDRVYIQGLFDYLSDSWVGGRLVDGKLVFDLPQFMGTIDNEYEISYPIYLVAFNQTTGRLYRQLTFDFDPATRTFSNQSSGISFGINKTGYLSAQDMYEAVMVPNETYPTGDVNSDGSVTIADVTALISYVLSRNASSINVAAADVNCDGNIDIADVTVLITILLRSN